MISLIKDRLNPEELLDVLELDIDTVVDLCYPYITEAIEAGKFEWLQEESEDG